MSDRHSALYDPAGVVAAELPLDRTTHEQLFRAVLSWSDPQVLKPDEYQQIGLLLAGAAHAVADDVRELAEHLPQDDGLRLFAELILREADGRLSQPCTSLHRVQNRARLVRALYEGLDRLQAAVPTDETAVVVSP
ncbi:restriction endonuclease [Streptomyces sp. NPDC058284]|uniref:restriction endonuclease n=1 Tax=unclassified Streptomyces TaxID=2593676 RepID=UPI003659AD09